MELEKLNWKVLLTLIILVVSINQVQAVAITKNVVLDPTGTLARFTWDCVYEDDKSAIVDSTSIMVGGIRCWCDPTVDLNVLVHAWNPENKNKNGETVFDFSTLANQAGSFTIKFGHLIPNSRYAVYKNGEKWKTLKTNDKGELEFYDRVHSQNEYVIKFAGTGAPGAPTPTPSPPPIPPIPPKPVPGFEVIFAIMGLLTAVWLLRR